MAGWLGAPLSVANRLDWALRRGWRLACLGVTAGESCLDSDSGWQSVRGSRKLTEGVCGRGLPL